MNNLKYYNESLAYDYDLFMPHDSSARAREPQKNIIAMPFNPNKQAKAKARRLNAGVFAVVMAAVLILGECAGIALRLRVNELNTQINRAKTELNTAQSECVALQMAYESRVSYANLEMEATALGMKKLDKNQVVYIRVKDTCTAKNGDGEILTATR